MFTSAFWLAAAERAARSGAASLASLLVADGTGVLDTLWVDRLSVAGMAAVVSLLLSVAAGKVNHEGPSFGPETIADGEGRHRA